MLPQRTILIADDQKHMLLLLQASLAPIGCRILAASSGEEALTKAAATSIDLLLIDFEMSGLSGVEAAQKLKENPLYSNLPVILITARGQQRIRKMAAQAGVTCIMTKPFSPAELLQTVQQLLAGLEPAIISEADQKL